MSLILAFESSCDETSAAIVEDGRLVKANIIASQIDIHQAYGGVVPEIASRHHLQAIMPVTKQALKQANCGFSDIAAIAVANGPGLVGPLLVGVSFAKALAYALDLPLIAVHHWQGHIAAINLNHQLAYPYLALVASGSHSGIIVVEQDNISLLGQSQDDAAGEAFDKIARALGLPYPGGPQIEKAAQAGDKDFCIFPRAKMDNPFDFSFSGLKSAVLNDLNKRRMQGQIIDQSLINNIAAAAQEAICDTLSAKTVAAAKARGLKNIALVGGVAANSRLRALLKERAAEHDINCLWPDKIFCTDNAAMIAAAAYPKYQKKDFAQLNLNAEPRLPF